MIIVNCVVCNKEIMKYPYELKNSKKGIFTCSPKCRSTYSSKIKINCAYCDKEMKLWPHRFKAGKRHFCSKKCHYAFGQPELKGIPRSEEVKKKISIKNKGNPHSEYQNKLTSERMKKAYQEWKRTGKTQYPWGKKFTAEHIKNLSESHKGHKPSEETKQKMRKIMKKKHASGEMEKQHESLLRGKDHPNWLGGKTSEKYARGHRKIRAVIRKRDNYRCQECFRHQSELDHTLHVHHIDYNKQNDDPCNLISLCRTCHIQTNFKRDDWQAYYKKRVRGEA